MDILDRDGHTSRSNLRAKRHDVTGTLSATLNPAGSPTPAFAGTLIDALVGTVTGGRFQSVRRHGFEPDLEITLRVTAGPRAYPAADASSSVSGASVGAAAVPGRGA
jgi:hypothetical protein